MAEGHHLVVAEGILWTRLQSGANFSSLGIPAGVGLLGNRPFMTRFRRAVVGVGRHTPGFVYSDEFNKAWALGIADPSVALTISTSGTGITGIVILYYNWRHKEGTSLIHQGNISPGSNSLSVTNQGVTTTNIPATAPDARTTHVGIWASVDGDIPKYVSEVTIGTTSFTWNGPVAARGDTVPVNSDGTINVGARGRPPIGTVAVRYHGRVWYLETLHPERVYYSLIEEGESVSPTAYLNTLGREATVGMGVQDDQLVVFGAEVMFDVQGYAGGGSNPDFTMRYIAQDIGCISACSVKSVFGRLHFASKRGPARYSGGGRPEILGDDKIQTFWIDEYKANRAAYEDCQGDYDVEHHAYKILIPGTPPFYYIVSYALGEDRLPEVHFMDRTRNDNSIGTLWDSESGASFNYVGGADGFLRKENQYTNADDDGDTLAKRLIIIPKHLLVQPSGGRAHGGTFKGLTLYIRSASQGYIVSAYGGDDPAAEADAPRWGPFTFGALHIAGKVDETSKFIRLTRMSGKGMTLKIQVNSPIGFEYRGFSVDHVSGSQSGGLKA